MKARISQRPSQKKNNQCEFRNKGETGRTIRGSIVQLQQGIGNRSIQRIIGPRGMLSSEHLQRKEINPEEITGTGEQTPKSLRIPDFKLTLRSTEGLTSILQEFSLIPDLMHSLESMDLSRFDIDLQPQTRLASQVLREMPAPAPPPQPWLPEPTREAKKEETEVSLPESATLVSSGPFSLRIIFKEPSLKLPGICLPHST